MTSDQVLFLLNNHKGRVKTNTEGIIGLDAEFIFHTMGSRQDLLLYPTENLLAIGDNTRKVITYSKKEDQYVSHIGRIAFYDMEYIVVKFGDNNYVREIEARSKDGQVVTIDEIYKIEADWLD